METLVVVLNKSTQSIIDDKLKSIGFKNKEKEKNFNENKKRLLPYIAELTKRLVDINNLVEYTDNSNVSIGGANVRRFISGHSREVLDFQSYFDSINRDVNFEDNGVVFAFKELGIKIWLNTDYIAGGGSKMNYTNLVYSLSYLGHTPRNIDFLIEIILDNILTKKI